MYEEPEAFEFTPVLRTAVTNLSHHTKPGRPPQTPVQILRNDSFSLPSDRTPSLDDKVSADGMGQGSTLGRWAANSVAIGYGYQGTGISPSTLPDSRNPVHRHSNIFWGGIRSTVARLWWGTEGTLENSRGNNKHWRGPQTSVGSASVS